MLPNFARFYQYRKILALENPKRVKCNIHISIESGPDNFERFFFALPFLVLLDRFPCLISGEGCVLWRCWWMAASGSDWNIGWLRTALNCLLSFSLIKHTGLCESHHFQRQQLRCINNITICLHWQGSTAHLFCSAFWTLHNILLDTTVSFSCICFKSNQCGTLIWFRAEYTEQQYPTRFSPRYQQYPQLSAMIGIYVHHMQKIDQQLRCIQMHPKRNTNLENTIPQITCREKRETYKHFGPTATWINSSASKILYLQQLI